MGLLLSQLATTRTKTSGIGFCLIVLVMVNVLRFWIQNEGALTKSELARCLGTIQLSYLAVND